MMELFLHIVYTEPSSNSSHKDSSIDQLMNDTTDLMLSPSNNSFLVCSDGFFYDQNGTGLCRPECGAFRRVPLSRIIIEILAIVASFLGSIAMFLITLTVQRKKM